MHRGAFTFTRPRVLSNLVVVALALVGSLLPYLTLAYDNYASERIRPTHALWPALSMMRRLNLTYLPTTTNAAGDTLQHGVDVVTLGASCQQVGVVVAIVTVAGLFMDEINKFFWWPLHLSGWLLALGGPVLLIGARMLHRAGVDLVVGLGWVPLSLVGVLVLVLTFRSWSRIDQYRGF